ncbi:MAG: DUF6115 domain-containing protein [Chitinophagales bacterium]
MEWVLFGLGVLAIGGALYLGFRERRDYARLQERASKEPGDLEEISLVVADLEQELTQTAERIVTALEERAETLRRLIAEAREVAEQAGAASEPAPAAQAVHAVAPAAEAAPAAEQPKPAKAPRKSGRAKETPVAAESAAAPGKGGEGGVKGQEAAAPRGWRTMETRVWELARQGRDVEEIARELSIGKGEVKLILDLRKAQAR